MSILSTTIYTVASEEDAQRFASMAEGMTAAYKAQPGFERLIVARDVAAPLTFVTLSWWESEEALRGWGSNPAYRQAKDDSGGQGLKAKMVFGKWVPAPK